MRPPHIEQQIERIEQIQAELRTSIMDDALPGLEPLIDEMGTRLKLLLNGREPVETLLPYRQRLETLVRNNERLEELMNIQLRLVEGRLQKTHATKHVFELYAGETYRFKQLAKHVLDVDG